MFRSAIPKLKKVPNYRLFHSSIVFKTPASMAKEFQLKGITSLDSLKDGEMKSYEVEGIEGANVLLAHAGGKVNALSPKCTHYGAPMVKGVLHGTRITCPWHGACFNATTGDVEDAPALDSLATFKLEEKNGSVYVTGDEKVLKNNFPKSLDLSCQAQGQDKILVVGGGAGAEGAVEGLRNSGFKGYITIISSEGYQPIDRTKLSKALLADVKKLAWRSKDFYKAANIELVEDEVTQVDFSGKKVSTKSGTSHTYTKLILATGGTPRWLPLAGLKGDLGNVFVLRTIPHVQSILAALGDEGSKKVVVIGSSFIGLEVANAIVGKKHDVSVVGMEGVPLERVMGKTPGKIFQALLEKNGIKFHMNASVDKATPSEKDSSKVGAVLLKDGTKLEADVVIEGVGVGPATSYLKDNTTVTLLKDGSLETDETFLVKGLQDVYAIGDIATYPYKGHSVRIEHWNVAQNAGRSVANTILGKKTETFIPIFWSAIGQQLRYCGSVHAGYDDVLILGETGIEKPSWVAYYTQGEEVVAVATMGKDPIMAQAANLLRLNKMPKKAELKGGLDILSL